WTKHAFAGCSISRAGRSAVRIAYSRPRKDHGVEIVTVYLSAGGANGAYISNGNALDLKVRYTSVFTPSKSDTYEFLPSFIQRTDPQRASDNANVSVLYWFEADYTKHTFKIR